MEFQYNGKIIMLDYKKEENMDLFIERGNFIIKNIDLLESFDELEKLSYIYIYNKFYNCIYNKELLNKIKELNI